MTPRQRLLSRILQLFAAGILAWSTGFKFSGHPDSVALFSALGMEPTGRILIAVIELAAAGLLLRNATAVWGAILGLGTMMGALIAHATKLGFRGDAGTLGALAVVVLLCCLGVVVLRRKDSPLTANMFADAQELEADRAENEARRDGRSR